MSMQNSSSWIAGVSVICSAIFGFMSHDANLKLEVVTEAYKAQVEIADNRLQAVNIYANLCKGQSC